MKETKGSTIWLILTVLSVIVSGLMTWVVPDNMNTVAQSTALLIILWCWTAFCILTTVVRILRKRKETCPQPLNTGATATTGAGYPQSGYSPSLQNTFNYSDANQSTPQNQSAPDYTDPDTTICEAFSNAIRVLSVFQAYGRGWFAKGRIVVGEFSVGDPVIIIRKNGSTCETKIEEIVEKEQMPTTVRQGDTVAIKLSCITQADIEGGDVICKGI